MNGPLHHHQVGQLLGSLVDLAKGQLGSNYAVSIIARHRKGPFHVLLGDDAEMAIMRALGELQRMGTDLVRDGVELVPPKRSQAEQMFDLLTEIRDHLETPGCSGEARKNNDLASRIADFLDPPVDQPADKAK